MSASTAKREFIFVVYNSPKTCIFDPLQLLQLTDISPLGWTLWEAYRASPDLLAGFEEMERRVDRGMGMGEKGVEQ